MSNTTELTTAAPSSAVQAAPIDGWKLAVRKAEAYAQSTMVPQQYQGNVPNCIIAMEMAERMGASPMMVMQNLYIVHGNPGWSSKFLIASFNQCGRFSALRYDWSQDRTSCRAWAIEKATGDRIDGPEVTMEMAKLEGWSTKSGSKWKTMPELMLMYRAAAFLVRTHAPEISMGLQTQEELVDVEAREIHPTGGRQAKPSEVSELLGVAPAQLEQSEAPVFDVAAFIDRIAACNDVQTLQLFSDEAETLPAGEEREAVLAALLKRDQELAAA
jgi:hypothetical protein